MSTVFIVLEKAPHHNKLIELRAFHKRPKAERYRSALGRKWQSCQYTIEEKNL